MRNFEIARLFYEMANLLEVRGESVFRVRAYQRGAQTLETLSEDVAVLGARGALQTLPNIGKDLAAKIQEYLATGRIPQRAPRAGLVLACPAEQVVAGRPLHRGHVASRRLAAP